MDIISYEYTKQRKDYGKHVQFHDSVPCITSVHSTQVDAESEINKQWVLPNVTTIELQCLPDISVHEVNTERYITHSKPVSFVDGGWPVDVKANDAVDKQRYIRRLVLEPQYSSSIMQLCKSIDSIINSNNTIDLYEQYYPRTALHHTGNGAAASQSNGQGTDIANTQTNIKTIAVFRDPLSHKQRSATSISWYPDTVDNGGAKLAVSYSTLQFQQNVVQSQQGNSSRDSSDKGAASVGTDSSFNWDTSNPNVPDTAIQSTNPLTCLKYNPRSPDHLLVGHYNGCISFYDLRKSNNAIEMSQIELSHSDPVYDLAWVQSRSGNECVSVSTDGYICWWDIRKLKAGPIDKMLMKDEQSGIVYGALSLEYKSDAGATRYLIGTEQGVALLCDRKAKKDSDSIKAIKTMYGAGNSGGQHNGPIYAIQRNPFNLKYFLTVGDWTAKVWFEDIKTPLITTSYSTTYLTAGCWSNSRPGVFYTGSIDGTLCVWDIYYKQHEPVYVTKVNTDIKITHLSLKSDGQQLAVASADGSVTVIKLSKNLTELQANEKTVISQLFESETKREKNLELRLIQRKRDAKDAEKSKAAQKTTIEHTSLINLDPNADDELKAILTQAEADFYTILEQTESSGDVPAATGEGGLQLDGQPNAEKDDVEEEKQQA